MRTTLTAVLILLVSSFQFYSNSALAADQCVFLLGDQKDWNGAFSSFAPRFAASRTPEGAPYGKFNCHGFDSWQDAEKYLDQQTILPNDQILFVQYAHGTHGGDGYLNSGWAQGYTIRKIVSKYSKNNPVGLVLVSCYSGDLLRDVVTEHYFNQQVDSNLCVLPASPFGEYGFGFDPLKQPASNLTQMYFNNSYQFTTSALPFSEIGLDAMWSNKKTAEETLKALVDKAMTFPQLTEAQKAVLKISIDQRFRFRQRLTSSAENRLAYARMLIENAIQKQQIFLDSEEANKKSPQVSCRQEILSTLKPMSQLDDTQLTEALTQSTLFKNLIDIQKQSSCQKLVVRRHLLPVAGSGSVYVDFLKLFDEAAYFDDKNGDNQGIETRHFLFKLGALKDILAPGFQIPPSEESYALLEKTAEFQMSPPRSDGDARGILMSIIGSWESPINIKRLFSTPESLTSSNRFDQVRKKACDNFVF